MVALGIDEQHLVLESLGLALVEEPQRARQALGVEEVVAHVEHHVHVARLHELAALGLLGLGIGGRGRHDKARSAMLVEVGVEVVDPEVVGPACGDLLLLVGLGRAQGQAARVERGGVLDLVHVEGRVGGHEVARAVERVGVVVEGISLVARLDVALHAVDGHVHEAELGVVVDLLLAVEHHALGGVAAVLAHIVAGRDEHAARAAGRVEHLAARGLDDVHDHADERLGREEDAVVAGHRRGELAEEVLVDAADDVVALLIEGGVVEDADDAA